VTYIIVAAAVLVLLIAVNKLGMRPARHRDLDTPGLRALLELLYVRGQEGAYLQVAVIDSSQSARVYKHIVRPDDVELSVHIPQATYALVGLEHLKKAFAPYGVPTSLGASNGPATPDDLVVNCGPNISKALVLAEFLFREALHVDLQRQCVAHIQHAHPNPRAHPGFTTTPVV
jgi:hypothetical protein